MLLVFLPYAKSYFYLPLYKEGGSRIPAQAPKELTGRNVTNKSKKQSVWRTKYTFHGDKKEKKEKVVEFLKSFFETAWGKAVLYCFPLHFVPEIFPKVQLYANLWDRPRTAPHRGPQSHKGFLCAERSLLFILQSIKRRNERRQMKGGREATWGKRRRNIQDIITWGV